VRCQIWRVSGPALAEGIERGTRRDEVAKEEKVSRRLA
jgi:hypothetical protein